MKVSEGQYRDIRSGTFTCMNKVVERCQSILLTNVVYSTLSMRIYWFSDKKKNDYVN